MNEADWDRSQPVPERIGWALLAAMIAAPTIGAAAAGLAVAPSKSLVAGAAFGALTCLAAFAAIVGPLRRHAWRIVEGTWLVGVPLWGLALDLTSESCPPCDLGQPVAVPGVAAVYVAYGVGLVGWGFHRRQAESYGGLREAALQGGLWAGIVACTGLALQFGPIALEGVMFAPIGLPLAAPPVAGACFAGAALVRARVALDGLVAGGLAAAGVFGADAVAHRWLTGDFGLWGGAFAKTCGWTMSTLEPPSCDGHYLCTVAARGHPFLVRPLRMGRRGGRPIVVNRQLAVANAFEDLLHERWPRFGRWARATYDRYGLPISHRIRTPLAADAVFLAMLPAQAMFELTLVVLDPEPEARIDRMYR